MWNIDLRVLFFSFYNLEQRSESWNILAGLINRYLPLRFLLDKNIRLILTHSRYSSSFNASNFRLLSVEVV